MIRVRVLYFAALRDSLGRSEEELELPASVATVSAFRDHVQEVHPALSGRLTSVRIALNESFADDAAPMGDGDVVALIPPVAGG